MAYIRVEHDKFEASARAIDAYVASLKQRIGAAQGEVNALSAQWQGEDAAQFQKQWEMVTAADATYTQMVKALESYARYLRYAAVKYKDAQAKAVDRAGRLPKW